MQIGWERSRKIIRREQEHDLLLWSSVRAMGHAVTYNAPESVQGQGCGSTERPVIRIPEPDVRAWRGVIHYAAQH